MRIGLMELVVIGLIILMFYSPEKAKNLKEYIKGFLKTFYDTKRELTDAAQETDTTTSEQEKDS